MSERSAGPVARELPLVTLRVRGADRRVWLNGLVTQDLEKCPIPSARYGYFCQKNGKLLADAWFYLAAEEILVGVREPYVDALAAQLDRFIVMEDVEITRSSTQKWWLVWGEAAGEGGNTVGSARGEGTLAAPLRGFGSDASLVISASIVPPAPALSDAQWLPFRLQNGWAEFGVDYGPDNYPQEGSLEKIGVSFDKGCYLGQEAVFMLEKRGHVSKKLVRVVLGSGASVPQVGETVGASSGEEIGKVTSAASAEGVVIALAMVKYKYAVEGAGVRVGNADAVVQAAAPVR